MSSYKLHVGDICLYVYMCIALGAYKSSLTEESRSGASGNCVVCCDDGVHESLLESVVKRRCKLARTSLEGCCCCWNAFMKPACPLGGEVYPENGDSDGGERGEVKRSSSRRSLRPFLKAMMERAVYRSWSSRRLRLVWWKVTASYGNGGRLILE